MALKSRASLSCCFSRSAFDAGGRRDWKFSGQKRGMLCKDPGEGSVERHREWESDVSSASSRARRPLTLHDPAGRAVWMCFGSEDSVRMSELGISRIVSPAWIDFFA